ncbi:MAG: helix-hairpin-helix domain-containing protein [Ruminiclostridium sp.]|nr:helix-hairpin-helix domain-containing protein [Ruminiclostridium sp.]
MTGKIQKISAYEWVVLALTLLFAAGTLLWFQFSRPEAGVTLVAVREDRQGTAPAEKPQAPGMLAGEILDLNTASLSDFTRLPGIGETKAQAILTWRETYGPFRAVEDLLSVEGIGEKTLESLRPYIAVMTTTEEGGDPDGTDPGG